ncbi:copper homeostasis protein CutC [Sphingomonas sp. Leaf412]|nr:copper homeostasis protein CutC [Sphingomonas sp. Leaf412]
MAGSGAVAAADAKGVRVALEICVEGPAGARAAHEGGADRVELCAALALGGVTPSAGVVAATVAVGLPVHVLIRPATGHFVMDRDLVDAVARDIRACVDLGAAGVVVGALKADGTLDLDALARWRDVARGIAMTLHRAVDLCSAPVEAATQAARIGIDRILTSGGARTAAEGADTIAAMVAAVRGSVAVIAGSGITAATVRALIAATGVDAIHASAGTSVPWADPRIAAFGFGGATERRTDPAAVAALRAALDDPA